MSQVARFRLILWSKGAGFCISPKIEEQFILIDREKSVTSNRHLHGYYPWKSIPQLVLCYYHKLNKEAIFVLREAADVEGRSSLMFTSSATIILMLRDEIEFPNSLGSSRWASPSSWFAAILVFQIQRQQHLLLTVPRRFFFVWVMLVCKLLTAFYLEIYSCVGRFCI
jgi:hypothetical protein